MKIFVLLLVILVAYVAGYGTCLWVGKKLRELERSLRDDEDYYQKGGL